MAGITEKFAQSCVAFKICLFAAATGCVLQTIAVFTKYWYQSGYDSSHSHGGLFYHCGHGLNTTHECSNLMIHRYALPLMFISWKLLELSGLVMMWLSLGCLIGQLLIRNKSSLLVLGIVIPLLAGIMITTGTVIFVRMMLQTQAFGVSFYLSATAGVLSLLLSVPACINRQDYTRRGEDVIYRNYPDQVLYVPPSAL